MTTQPIIYSHSVYALSGESVLCASRYMLSFDCHQHYHHICCCSSLTISHCNLNIMYPAHIGVHSKVNCYSFKGKIVIAGCIPRCWVVVSVPAFLRPRLVCLWNSVPYFFLLGAFLHSCISAPKLLKRPSKTAVCFSNNLKKSKIKNTTFLKNSTVCIKRTILQLKNKTKYKVIIDHSFIH